MKISKNWKQITIGQYQLIKEINPESERVDKEIWLLCILTGKPYEYFEALPGKELENLIAQTAWMDNEPQESTQHKVRIGWYWYKFTANKAELNAQQFALVQKLFQEDRDFKMHEILSCLSVRYNIFGKKVRVKNAVDEFEFKATLFKTRLNIADAMSRMLFFWEFYNKSLKDTLTYLKREMVKVNQIGQSG